MGIITMEAPAIANPTSIRSPLAHATIATATLSVLDALEPEITRGQK